MHIIFLVGLSWLEYDSLLLCYALTFQIAPPDPDTDILGMEFYIEKCMCVKMFWCSHAFDVYLVRVFRLLYCYFVIYGFPHSFDSHIPRYPRKTVQCTTFVFSIICTCSKWTFLVRLVLWSLRKTNAFMQCNVLYGISLDKKRKFL